MKTSRRGGARQGAGRKPILTDEQRLQIGAAIHRRLWRRTRAAFARAVDGKFADDDLSALWAELNKIPTADRRKVDLTTSQDSRTDRSQRGSCSVPLFWRVGFGTHGRTLP
jgi:hypothetical protein